MRTSLFLFIVTQAPADQPPRPLGATGHRNSLKTGFSFHCWLFLRFFSFPWISGVRLLTRPDAAFFFDSWYCDWFFTILALKTWLLPILSSVSETSTKLKINLIFFVLFCCIFCVFCCFLSFCLFLCHFDYFLFIFLGHHFSLQLCVSCCGRYSWHFRHFHWVLFLFSFF